MICSVFASLYALIEKKYPTYASQWIRSRNEFGPEWEKQISLNIERVFGKTYNERWEEAVRGYAEFCTDSLRSQVFFEKYGTYKAKSYDECVKFFYKNPDYMLIRYLPGQYLSHYIWPHHYRMLRHYLYDLLPKIIDNVTTFYEVGVGCGMYSQKTLEMVRAGCGVGFDISDYALQFTLRVMKAHGLDDRYDICEGDILEEEIEKEADLVISQEVLEHLERPEPFIEGLYRLARRGGWGYITAAVNAAHTDHIYLYRTPEEVRVQIERVGWKVLDTQVEWNYPDKPKEIRPTIVAFLVKKE